MQFHVIYQSIPQEMGITTSKNRQTSDTLMVTQKTKMADIADDRTNHPIWNHFAEAQYSYMLELKILNKIKLKKNKIIRTWNESL
jgi:hypothetical protein